MWKSDKRLNAVTSRTLSDQCSHRPKRSIVIVASMIVAVLSLGVGSRALAFSNPQDYGRYPLGGDPTLLGGGAGRYYTGSPADGYSCENCHSARTPYSFPIQLTGLPSDGYVPGQPYKIEISSPQADIQLAQAAASNNKPAASMTAEFIAEDGSPAGSLSFVNGSDFDPVRFPGQYCDTLAMVAPTSAPDEYATVLYQVDTGVPSTELTLAKSLPDDGLKSCSVEHGTNKDGEEYDRRCVATMKSCGAKTMKFIWTAPEKWSGAIWFSMGYVATYNLSGEPNDNDYVTTMTVPLNPSFKGPTFETELNSGCSMMSGTRHNMASHGWLTLTLGLVVMLIARSRQRRRRSLLLLAAALSTIGCGDQGKGLVTDVPANVSQYDSIGCIKDCTPPINCRMAAWPDAGTPETVAAAKKAAMMMPAGAATAAASTDPFNPLAPAGAAGGDATTVAPPADAPKSLGSVSLAFASAQPDGVVSDYASKCMMQPCWPNYLAAWIVNDKGEYVRMMHTQMGTYVVANLPEYTKLGTDCQTPKESLPMDAIAMATLFVHEQYNFVWDGLYGNGHIAAPPGLYRLRVEVAIDEKHKIEIGEVPFMFGDPAPYNMIVEPAPSHTAVTLTYTPNP